MLIPLLATTLVLASLTASWPTSLSPQQQLVDQSNSQPALIHPSVSEDQTTPSGWADPRDGGGRMLDWAYRRYGEPLNVIISGNSDPRILTLAGLQRYANSLGFAEECLGLHYGRIHIADLGDGRGQRDEEFLGRQTYFPVFGTCWQSLVGGHHFRAWQQNGTQAWFLAVSKEMNSERNHKIEPDGYNLGRNFFVERAIAGSSYRGMWWQSEVEWRSGLLEPGHQGVNHNISQDGRTAILTVYRI